MAERNYAQELDDSIAELARATAKLKRTLELNPPAALIQSHCYGCGTELDIHYSHTHECLLCDGCRVEIERSWS